MSAHIGLCRPISAYIGLYRRSHRPMSADVGPHLPMCPVGPCRPMSAQVGPGRPCRPRSAHIGVYRAMSAHIGPCRRISAYIDLCRSMSANVGHIVPCRRISASVGTCQPGSAHIGPCRPMSVMPDRMSGPMCRLAVDIGVRYRPCQAPYRGQCACVVSHIGLDIGKASSHVGSDVQVWSKHRCRCRITVWRYRSRCAGLV